LNKIHSAERKQASLHEKALESIELLQKHSDNVKALQMEANAVSAQNEAEVEKLKQTLREYESSLPMQQQLICNHFTS
jgi:sulfatase maturation enzyme AslB (radical SAM superfamily)